MYALFKVFLMLTCLCAWDWLSHQPRCILLFIFESLKIVISHKYNSFLYRSLVNSISKWPYLSPGTTNRTNEGILLSSTNKVWESDVCDKCLFIKKKTRGITVPQLICWGPQKWQPLIFLNRFFVIKIQE